MIALCTLSSKDYEEYVQEEWMMQACTQYVDGVQTNKVGVQLSLLLVWVAATKEEWMQAISS